MRTLLVSFLLLSFAALPAMAQGVSGQDMQSAARAEIDRIMAASPPPAPAPAVAEKPKAEPETKPEPAPVPAPEAAAPPPQVAKAPAAPCKPEEKKDPSGKLSSLDKKYGQRQAEIDKMDANCDGVLQPEEMQKGVEARFAAADTNKDGVLSEEESAAIVEQFRTEAQQENAAAANRGSQKLKNLLGKVDKDGDGNISAEEYKGFYGDRYRQFDQNGDGGVDVKEFRSDTEKNRIERNPL